MNTPKSSKKQSSPQRANQPSVTPQAATPSAKKTRRQAPAKKQMPQQPLDFLSFQPALQSCFVTPSQKESRRSPKFSSQANGFNNSLSPVKLSSPAIAPILKQSQPRRSGPQQPTRGSPPSMFKQTPFAGAKYLELPSNKDLPQPPAWLIADLPTSITPLRTVSATTVISEVDDSSSPIGMMEPPSPTTAAAIKVAKENGFDGSVRIHPLQLIAAVCSS